jgi:hypothetical protein
LSPQFQNAAGKEFFLMTKPERRSRVSREFRTILDTLTSVTRIVKAELLHPGARAVREIVSPPWIDRPFTLISLLEMQKFFAYLFVELAKALEALAHLPAAVEKAGIRAGTPISDKVYTQCRQFLDALSVASGEAGLKLSVISIEKATEEIASSRPSYNKLREIAGHLQTTIQHEMSTHLFLYVDNATYYEDKQLFGQEVFDKFPEMVFDIQEAGKCLALNRYTASVFHLMRVMEMAVQRFGKRLRVKLVREKVWQNILDEVNKAIKNMKARTPGQKARQTAYAGAAAHLFSVKVAWRNPVMHPKAQYDGEEAEEIFKHVKAFTRQLAKIL